MHPIALFFECTWEHGMCKPGLIMRTRLRTADSKYPVILNLVIRTNEFPCIPAVIIKRLFDLQTNGWHKIRNARYRGPKALGTDIENVKMKV